MRPAQGATYWPLPPSRVSVDRVAEAVRRDACGAQRLYRARSDRRAGSPLAELDRLWGRAGFPTASSPPTIRQTCAGDRSSSHLTGAGHSDARPAHRRQNAAALLDNAHTASRACSTRPRSPAPSASMARRWHQTLSCRWTCCSLAAMSQRVFVRDGGIVQP